MGYILRIIIIIIIIIIGEMKANNLKFRLLVQIQFFGLNFDFWPKFCFLNKILTFEQNFDF